MSAPNDSLSSAVCPETRAVAIGGATVVIRPLTLSRLSACARILADDPELIGALRSERGGPDVVLRLIARAPEILCAAIDLPDDVARDLSSEEAASAIAALLEVNREPAKKALSALTRAASSTPSSSSSAPASDGRN